MNQTDQEFLVQKIRTQYTEKELTQLDELKALDKRVKKPAVVFSYVFGAISAMVLGCGMSLVMTDLGEILGINSPMVPGIILGIVGMYLTIINYPIHKKLLASRRKKYAPQIIALSDQLTEK